jgi:hypothetical protein
MHHSIDPHAAGRGMSNRRTGQLWYIGIGTVVIAILATLALDVRGVIFAGSVSQVHAICTSGLGVFAQALNANTANACSQAGPVYDLLYWGRILVLIGGIALFVRTWHLARREAAQGA